jgi:uncharacterized protein
MTPTRLRVRVSPGAARAAVVGRHGGGWKLRVAATPENGRANNAVVRLLADTLSLPRSAVRLVSARRAREKIIELAGIDATQAERSLAAAAGKERS